MSQRNEIIFENYYNELKEKVELALKRIDDDNNYSGLEIKAILTDSFGVKIDQLDTSLAGNLENSEDIS